MEVLLDELTAELGTAALATATTPSRRVRRPALIIEDDDGIARIATVIIEKILLYQLV